MWRRVCLAISFAITASLFMAVVSIFLYSNPREFLKCVSSREMEYSIFLSLVTSAVATFLVILTAVPLAYALARYEFPARSLVKTIVDLPIAFPELVLGLCLLIMLGKNTHSFHEEGNSGSPVLYSFTLRIPHNVLHF